MTLTLLQLPPKLRKRLYEQVFQIHDLRQWSQRENVTSPFEPDGNPNALALSQTYPLIRTELLPLFLYKRGICNIATLRIEQKSRREFRNRMRALRPLLRGFPPSSDARQASWAPCILHQSVKVSDRGLCEDDVLVKGTKRSADTRLEHHLCINLVDGIVEDGFDGQGVGDPGEFDWFGVVNAELVEVARDFCAEMAWSD